MTDAEQQEVIIKSINLLGLQGQVDQFHEEVGELLTAINHYKRGRNTIEDLIVEIVDVNMMLKALRTAYMIKDEDYDKINIQQWDKFKNQIDKIEI